jgi:uncharacterized membrane protein
MKQQKKNNMIVYLIAMLLVIILSMLGFHYVGLAIFIGTVIFAIIRMIYNKLK